MHLKQISPHPPLSLTLFNPNNPYSAPTILVLS